MVVRINAYETKAKKRKVKTILVPVTKDDDYNLTARSVLTVSRVHS